MENTIGLDTSLKKMFRETFTSHSYEELRKFNGRNTPSPSIKPKTKHLPASNIAIILLGGIGCIIFCAHFILYLVSFNRLKAIINLM